MPDPNPDGSVAFYGDIGVRAIMKHLYLFGKVKYLGATKSDVPNYGGKADFSGVSILAGVGFTF